MVIFTVVPLAMVAYFAFTTSSGSSPWPTWRELRNTCRCCCAPVWYALVCLCHLPHLHSPRGLRHSQTSASTQRVLYLLVTLPMCMSFTAAHPWPGWPLLPAFKYLLAGLGTQAPHIHNAGSVIMGMVYACLPYT